MRPHRNDLKHNRDVGVAFRNMVQEYMDQGAGQWAIDVAVGSHVNAVAQAAYDLALQELQPSQN